MSVAFSCATSVIPSDFIRSSVKGRLALPSALSFPLEPILTRKWVLATLAGMSISTAHAQMLEHGGEDELIIWGRALDLTGKASAASQGVIGYADFSTRPIMRVGELVEVVPGLIATQHSGSGKANQYFLRGFNLDHGTDFAAYFDAVPVNLRTHGHGQGYLDLNFVIPELVEVVEYSKGTHHAANGDFSSAGTARIRTYDQLEKGFVELTVGSNNYYRGIAADSFGLGPATLLLAVEGEAYDGPWKLEEDLEKVNSLIKYTIPLERGRMELAGTFYQSDWRGSDQIPERAVEQGLISRYGFIDPDLGGETTRASLTGQIEIGGLTASVYAVAYDFRLFSNFTYFLTDPVNGDEFEQRDKRTIWGGSADYAHDFGLVGREAVVRIGTDVRHDKIDHVGLYQTVSRRRISTVRKDAVDEFSIGGYVELEANWTDRLRTMTGIRADHYRFDVASHVGENSGDGNDSILSPKLSIAYLAGSATEFYGNYGQSFHSNDVRGATTTIDPATGAAVDQVEPLVKSEGAELGVRTRLAETLLVTLSAFWLDLDSELVFVGDAGTTEPNLGSRRYGVEVAAFWQLADWLTLDLSAATTRARFRNAPDGENRIPGSIKEVLGVGAVATFDTGLTGSLRLRHFGSMPLIEDGSLRSGATTLVNLGLAYKVGAFEFSFDIFNLFDANDYDITYYFESRLPGEGASVADVHFHPVEPRSARAAIKVRF